MSRSLDGAVTNGHTQITIYDVPDESLHSPAHIAKKAAQAVADEAAARKEKRKETCRQVCLGSLLVVVVGGLLTWLVITLENRAAQDDADV